MVRRADSFWRVVELDGEPARSWLPGIEADSRQGPLDRGGFQRSVDAWAFSLGVDHERTRCAPTPQNAKAARRIG